MAAMDAKLEQVQAQIHEMCARAHPCAERVPMTRAWLVGGAWVSTNHLMISAYLGVRVLAPTPAPSSPPHPIAIVPCLDGAPCSSHCEPPKYYYKWVCGCVWWCVRVRVRERVLCFGWAGASRPAQLLVHI